MAKGFEKNKERLQTLSSFGKDLTRRAKSRCELCDASGVKLLVYEVPPVPTEPDFNTCLLICDTCRDQLNHPGTFSPDHWRKLQEKVWSEIKPLQVLSYRILCRLKEEHHWANEILESLYLEEDVKDWAKKSDI